MTSAPVLRRFNPKLPIIVTTDASGYALGAVLEQDENNIRRPVAFHSRCLNTAEQNYHAQEQELLAIVDSLRAWRAYLYGQTFVVHTDHFSLKYLETQERLSERQVRWLQTLVSLDFKIIPIRGTTNTVADALSRKHTDAPDKTTSDQKLLNTVLDQTKVKPLMTVSTLSTNTQHHKTIVDGYKTDPFFKNIMEKLKPPYNLAEDILYRDKKLCIPSGPVRAPLLHDHHDTPFAAHMGFRKTYDRLSKSFYWPGLKKDVQEYVRTCDVCQKKQKYHVAAPWDCYNPLNHRRQNGPAFQWISLDHFPRPKRVTCQYTSLSIV